MTKELDKAREAAQEWYLGQTSAMYESGPASAGAISTGEGDHGGVSYGSYQFSSSTGTLQEYLQQSSYGEQFKGLIPVTPNFDGKWRELARTDPGFGQDQHDFVGRSHYGVQMLALQASGIDLSDRGMAVQDAMWSTSVQFRNLTPGIFSSGLTEKFGANYDLAGLSDKDVVDAVQDYKTAHVATLFSRSPKLHDSLKSRFASEKFTLEQLADADALLKANHVIVEHPNVRSSPDSTQPSLSVAHSLKVLRLGSMGKDVATLQSNLATLGYEHGHHPLKADGDFGPATRSAVEAFQRTHALKADGIAGPATARALEHTTLQQSALQAMTMDRPEHPGHTMFQQSLACVGRLDASQGRATDMASYNLSGALAVAARREGLERIDHVILSEDATRAIAVQGDFKSSLRRFADVDVVSGVNTPLAQSSTDWSQCQPQAQAMQAPTPLMQSANVQMAQPGIPR